MSSETSDEDVMKNVFQLRERLMQTENSLQKINRLAEIREPSDIATKLSFSEPYLQGSTDSVNLPPPLTLDDLGEFTQHDETDYSPVDESVLRQWNMNNDRKVQNRYSASHPRSPSPEFRLRVSQGSHKSSQSSQHSFKQNLKNFAPQKIIGPSASSPNVGQYATRAGQAYSCDDLSTIDTRGIYPADSYRVLNQPSMTSHFSMSAPISPRKDSSNSRRQAVSPSYSDIINQSFGIFEPMQRISSDSSVSSLANYTLQSPRKTAKHNTSLDSTLSELGKENTNSSARPVSARSNATSVTMLGVDAESDRLRGRLSMLREDNKRLHALVLSLRRQLETEKSEKETNDTRTVLNFKEEILALKEETEAGEKALRHAEEALERSEMVCQKKIENIVSLKDEISHLKSLLTESELSKESVTRNYKEAYQDARHLAQQLEHMEDKLNNVKKEAEKENAQHRQEIQSLEKFKTEISEKAAKLQHSNSQLQSDLRNALFQIESKDTKVTERNTEKVHISRALQDLQARFGDVRTDLMKKTEDLEVADRERTSLQKKFETFAEQNRLQQDRLSSCQRELEEYRFQISKLENELRKSKPENQHITAYTANEPIDSGRGASVTFGDMASQRLDADDCRCESTSPRKQKAIIAELKMKLAAKEAQVQRLEARVNNFSMEAEKLEGIRGELINVVERSRMGDKRAHELEGIVHQLEDERSKITRQFMECEDGLNDKKAECESLESRLLDRTKSWTKTQTELEEKQRLLTKLEGEVKKYSVQMSNLEKQLDSKTQECEERYKALLKAEEELAEKKRALDNAAEWMGKREAESKRETDKMKKIHKEQFSEMEAQIDKLQSDCDRYKEQARELDCVVCQLRQENEAILKQFKSTQSKLAEASREEALSREENQEALEKLEKKAKESSEQVSSLQSALAQCKADIRQYVDQLEEASSKFQHQMAVKNGQVTKLESELKVAQESLTSESLHAQALESSLSERRKSLEQASAKISELEDCQACLRSKVSKLENHLNKVNGKAQQEKQYWEGRLNTACKELDAKNMQFTQLNDALKEVDKEFGSCRKELATVDKQLEKLRSDSDDKTKRLEASQTELNNIRIELAAKNEKVSNLEDRLKQLVSERQNLHEKCLSQENELAKVKAELQSVSQQSSQVQSALQATDMDSKKKDTFIARLQSALREAKENLSTKERNIEELERALEDRQWELQQRAAQLGQLEVSVKEHKSFSEKRQIELQAEARKATIELKERNQQVSTLDDQLSDFRSELSEERHRVEEREQELRRVNRETEQKEERIKDLEKDLEESRSAYEERHRACLEITQELRVAREQSQRAAQQWQDAQRELTRLQRQQETLICDLDVMGKTEKEKESHVSELAGKLSSCEAQKAEVEHRYTAELDRMRNDVLKMHQQHQEEVSRMRSDYSRQVNDAKTKVGDRSEDLKIAMEHEREARTECESMRDVMTSLENELMARKHVIEAANDTIVIKEAEIARLEAKLAGMQRGKRMKEMSSPEKVKETADEQPDFLPSFLAPDAKEFSQTPKAGWLTHDTDDRSPQQPNGSLTLFSGLDPDSGSLSPSFVHIAASTKRVNAMDEHDASTSDIEESLFARVFDRQEHFEASSQRLLNARGSAGASRQITSRQDFELRPEHCMADLRERLRASEQRRQEVTSKLRQLKSNTQS